MTVDLGFGLTLNDYQKLAERTANWGPENTPDKRYSNFALGLGGETGELWEVFLQIAGLTVSAGKICERVKKHVHHDHPLDLTALEKELGDHLWYVATLAKAAGLKLSEVAAKNIIKLRERYPDGFCVDRSLVRLDHQRNVWRDEEKGATKDGKDD